jgi:hypothetical protein
MQRSVGFLPKLLRAGWADHLPLTRTSGLSSSKKFQGDLPTIVTLVFSGVLELSAADRYLVAKDQVFVHGKAGVIEAAFVPVFEAELSGSI